ncbi:hypothetical protein K523DRAFT_422443, partial [Schizophyllum commune Tattone D]
MASTFPPPLPFAFDLLSSPSTFPPCLRHARSTSEYPLLLCIILLIAALHLNSLRHQSCLARGFRLRLSARPLSSSLFPQIQVAGLELECMDRLLSLQHFLLTLVQHLPSPLRSRSLVHCIILLTVLLSCSSTSSSSCSLQFLGCSCSLPPPCLSYLPYTPPTLVARLSSYSCTYTVDIAINLPL